MSNMSNKCPECGEEMNSFHHYYVYKEGKVIEICKKCLDKRTVHRIFIKVQGKTRVID